MKKYQIYTIIALVLMTVCFTIPVLGFFGAKAKIAAGEPGIRIKFTTFTPRFSTKTT